MSCHEETKKDGNVFHLCRHLIEPCLLLGATEVNALGGGVFEIADLFLPGDYTHMCLFLFLYHPKANIKPAQGFLNDHVPLVVFGRVRCWLFARGHAAHPPLFLVVLEALT